MADGIAPPEVTDFREVESDELFAAGDAAFLRSWPLAVAIATAGELEPDQVGSAPLPVARAGDPSFSILGGWNLMIAQHSPNQAAAWEFIRYMADEEQQRIRASEGAFLRRSRTPGSGRSPRCTRKSPRCSLPASRRRCWTRRTAPSWPRDFSGNSSGGEVTS